MGDRVVILFAESGQDHVAVYKHHGGQEIAETLEAFFAAEDANKQHDNRFGDPEYLAARFLVWTSNSTGTGVGIVPVTRRETRNVRLHCDSGRHPRIESLADDESEVV